MNGDRADRRDSTSFPQLGSLVYALAPPPGPPNGPCTPGWNIVPGHGTGEWTMVRQPKARRPSRSCEPGNPTVHRRSELGGGAVDSSLAGAFEAFYRRYWPDINRLCSRLLLNAHRAEDLTQETFLRAYRDFATLDEERGVWPWLSTIARNLCIDELRSASSRIIASGEVVALAERSKKPFDETWEEVATRIKRDRLGGHLSEALATLPPRERRVVLRKILDDLTWDEIASIERSTPDTVRNLAWRARTALRPLLTQAKIESASLGLIPAFWLKIKKLASHCKLRAHRLCQLRSSDLGNGLGEQLGHAFLGLALVAATFLSPGIVSRSDIVTESSNSQILASEPIYPGAYDVPASGERDSENRSDKISTDTTKLLATSVETKPRERNRVAPPAGEIVVEVRGPNGRVLYRSERNYECDSPGAELLPDRGPVRAVC